MMHQLAFNFNEKNNIKLFKWTETFLYIVKRNLKRFSDTYTHTHNNIILYKQSDQMITLQNYM